MRLWAWALWLPLANAAFATRYWDCCKAHCSWPGNTPSTGQALPSCNKANQPLTDGNTQSSCDNNIATNAFTCWNNAPQMVDSMNAIGFAAIHASGGDNCGKCYELTFTGTGQYGTNAAHAAIAGKKMIVQATNIGSDVSDTQFDLLIPGGGVGIFNACRYQWGVTDLGAQYGGILTACQQGGVGYTNIPALKSCVSSNCTRLFGTGFPELLAGCNFFVNWFETADNPQLTWREVACPTALTDISKMIRAPPAPTTPAPTYAPGQCPPIVNCDCGWANADTCKNPDGSPCNIQCCCPFRQPTNLCSNHFQDPGEQGVDCGGTCPTACAFCSITNCGANGVCDPANSRCNCLNGYTGPVCATPPAVDPCANNKCGAHGTCNAQTGACTCKDDYSGLLCDQAPSCTDGIKNQQEIQIDCGGPNCATKPCTGYQWLPGQYSDCSKSCGGGTQTRLVTCIDPQGATASPTACDSLHQAITLQVCNVDPCANYTWHTSDPSPCSKPCGGGMQTITLTCVSSIGNSAVDASFCDPATRPAAAQGCNFQACTAPYWETGQWANCSASCGGGTQTRTVTCMDPSQSPPAPASTESKCTATKPFSQQSCKIVACPVYTWFPCVWDDCTTPCGGGDGMIGTATRLILCKLNTGQVVDPSLCDNATKPVSFQTMCNAKQCTQPYWMADGPWSACQNGMRNRTFHCHNANGTNAPVLTCQQQAAKPPILEACTLNACPVTTTTGDSGAVLLAPSITLVIISLMH